MTAITQSPPAIFALRTVCAGLRTVFHYAPWHFGKQWLWERIVHRYIIWRDLPIVARTRFGARLEGSFPDAVHSYVYFFGVWEPAITALYRAALKPGDVRAVLVDTDNSTVYLGGEPLILKLTTLM
jgi:hypothetical protein